MPELGGEEHVKKPRRIGRVVAGCDAVLPGSLTVELGAARSWILGWHECPMRSGPKRRQVLMPCRRRPSLSVWPTDLQGDWLLVSFVVVCGDERRDPATVTSTNSVIHRGRAADWSLDFRPVRVGDRQRQTRARRISQVFETLELPMGNVRRRSL